MSAVITLERSRKPVIANVVLGTILFVIVEVMFFTALISAYLIIRAGSGLNWVPPGDIRLPVEATAINTIALLISGILMVLATTWFSNQYTKSRLNLIGAMVLGTTFVIFQGQEWLKLISLGMTMLSGVFGSTFFLLIGMHGLHAVSAIVMMGYLLLKMNTGILKIEHLQAMTVYWLFIVGIWPILYWLIYF